jgi:tetratricopeptide (TPR) repeat protein
MRKRGQYSEAQALLRRGLVSFTTLGSKDLTFAEILDGLGTIDALQGNYLEATTLFARALQILQTTRATFSPRLGTRNEKMALTLIDLACATAQLRRYAEAVDEAERAQNLLQSLSDPPPRPMIKVLAVLGGLYAGVGRAAEAESAIKQALSLAEATYGTEDFCVAEVLERYAAILKQLNRKPEARSIEKRVTLIEKNAGHRDYSGLTINAMSLH